MSSCTSSAHYIKVSFFFAHKILTLEFPHREWAAAFTTFFQSTPYHRQKGLKCCIEKGYLVHMRVPTDLRRVEFKYPDEGLVFVFRDADSARQWVDSTGGMWRLLDQRKVSAVLHWSHAEMESRLRMWDAWESANLDEAMADQDTRPTNSMAVVLESPTVATFRDRAMDSGPGRY